MKVLGLDSSLTSTGLALLDNGVPTLSNVYSSGSKTDTTLDLCHRIIGIRNKVMTRIPPDTHCVVMEGVANFNRGNELKLYWLWGELFKTISIGLGVPVVVCPASTLKKFATDNGAAKKLDVAVRVSRMWPDVDVNGDDQADALALATAAAVRYREPVPFTVLERHRLAIAKMEWPT